MSWRPFSRRDRARRRAASDALGVDALQTDARAEAPEFAGMQRLIDALETMPDAAWSDVSARPPAPSRHRRVNRPRPRAVAGGLAAALVALAFVVGRLTDGAPGSQPHVRGTELVFRPLQPGADVSAVAVMTTPQQMLLHVTALPVSPAGTYYELWLMTDLRHLAPVAAFRVGSSHMVRLTLVLPDSPSNYAYFDISEQRLGAGVGHSNESVLRARIT